MNFICKPESGSVCNKKEKKKNEEEDKIEQVH